MQNSKAKVALVAAAALALVAISGTTAAFADTPSGSADKWYTMDGGTGNQVAAGTVLQWGTSVFASPSKTDVDATYTGPSDADGVTMFLSAYGDEVTPSKWIATGGGAFVDGTKQVLQPSARPSSLTNGQAAGAKASGGDFSIGIAFVKNNGLTVASGKVIFNHIHVQPGGAYTFDVPTETTTPPTTDPSLTGSIDLQANTLDSADQYPLSLVVPAGAKAIIGNPKLVGGLSTSTGTLGQVTVKDGRTHTHPGWDLTSSVATFVKSDDATKTIEAKQLGIKPKVVSGSGVAAAGNTAGTASDGKFANAVNTAAAADTVLDADLTFVAPADSKGGTYNSKMTLTLVSK